MPERDQIMQSAFAPQRFTRTQGPRKARLLMAAAGLVLAVGSAWADVPKDWWVSVTNDRASYVQTALARGTDPNVRTPDGQPAVMQAIREGAWNVYDVLIKQKKFDPNIENPFGETPLMYLAVVGQAERGQALIKRGAQVNRLGWTPLQYAASRGHLDMAKMLLKNGAIVNAPGPDGTTALMMAAFGGNQPMVQLLLDAGADVTMLTTQKENAAAWARKRGYENLAVKLDQLEQRMLAHRQQMRTQPGVALPEPVAALPVDPAPNAAAPKNSDNGTARYFDLDRFNKPSAP